MSIENPSKMLRLLEAHIVSAAEKDAQIAGLDRALAFYADVRNWKSGEWGDTVRDVISNKDFVECKTDFGNTLKNYTFKVGGKRARAARTKWTSKMRMQENESGMLPKGAYDPIKPTSIPGTSNCECLSCVASRAFKGG